ncbi:DegV family protein [Acutalibacter muris]|uniref:DegV family protein n=1 Tax=Acutalibacter muris TaxID=1796620 RepID=UPI00272EB855|nr:DegV family protein [Acutalibacter muris]
MVTTDSVCDLPSSLMSKFGIPVCPYYVRTEAGRFLDEQELKAGELLMHIAEGREGYSQAPEVEDYERFFAEKLTGAQNLIHITMAKHVSVGYQNACEAAKSFENVTVIDSGHLSSSMGLIVLCAAYMAEHHATKEDITESVKRMKRFISSAFVINDTHMLRQAGRISKQIQVLCDSLLLHPVLKLRKSKLVVGGIKMGGFRRVAKSYVRQLLLDTRNIDRRILFITYSGMDEKKLKYIQDLVQQYCPFERVYLQKSTSAIASNCGPGSFGLLFMKRDDDAISFFQVPGQDRAW